MLAAQPVQLSPAGSWQTWFTPPSELRDSARTTYRAALAAAIICGVIVMSLGLSTPAPWIDEAATMLAVRRTWPGVIALLGGADAPLVPYYLLSKAWRSALPWLSELTAIRSLSAASAVGSIATTFLLTARRVGTAPALLAAGFLLAMPGFSRFGQEARPYALLTLLTTMSWLAWDIWHGRVAHSGPTSRGSRRWHVAYIAAAAGGLLAHLFAALQYPAQFIADLTTPGLSHQQRRQRAARSAMALAIGAAVAAAPAWFAITRGTGTRNVPNATMMSVAGRTMTAISLRPEIWTGSILLTLAVVGVAVAVVVPVRRNAPAGVPDLARIASIWLLVPLALALSLVAVRPNFLQVRYLQPMLPPLALLASLGSVVLAELFRRRLSADRSATTRTALALCVLTLTVPLLVQGVIGVGAQVQLRSQDGHDPGAAPAIRALAEAVAANPSLPVLITPSGPASILLATNPGIIKTNVLYKFPDKSPEIWPKRRSIADTRQFLAGHQEAIWFAQPPFDRLPPLVHELGFTAEPSQKVGNWWLTRLKRSGSGARLPAQR